MIYKDPFVGDIELTKLGETPNRFGMGECVNEIIYTDERGNYYVQTCGSYNMLSDKIDMIFLNKSLIDKIKELA